MDPVKKSGIIFALLLGIIAYALNSILVNAEIFTPGAATIAFLLGICASLRRDDLIHGGKWCVKSLMPIIIIFLGFGLNLKLLLEPEIGILGITTIISTVILSFSICYFLGRLFKLELGTLVALGAGGAICGNSAVVAVAPSLKMKEENVAMVLAVINTLCLVTFLLIPIIAMNIGMSEIDAGIWAGSVIHAVPQTIAAGEAMGSEAMIISTAVKLSRVSLLVFIVPLCAYIGNKINSEESFENKNVKIPYFIPGFLCSAILSTWFLPEETIDFLVDFGKYLLLPMMASVGFFITFDSIKASAGPVFITGLIATICMVVVSFTLIQLF